MKMHHYQVLCTNLQSAHHPILKFKCMLYSTAPYLVLNTMYVYLPASTSKLLQDSAREYDTKSVKNKKEICPILASR